MTFESLLTGGVERKKVPLGDLVEAERGKVSSRAAKPNDREWGEERARICYFVEAFRDVSGVGFSHRRKEIEKEVELREYRENIMKFF